MDLYPYKDKMTLKTLQTTEEYLESVYETYRDEVTRLNENDGVLVAPEVIIEGKDETMVFENVEIKAHNLNHIPSDVRVITSPQYVKYFWICI